MDSFGTEAEGRIQEFSQQNLANMAWAFGKITHYMPSLLDAIGDKATSIVKVCLLMWDVWLVPCCAALGQQLLYDLLPGLIEWSYSSSSSGPSPFCLKLGQLPLLQHAA